ncbi:hypothetical protein L0Z72_15595 [candidate division KSB1 bacterium]|nr:hypothetical protein [candidate division KSB1 bacterium]
MQELIIFKKSYDFSKWLLNHTIKFPKSHRFSVAVRLENGILEFLRQTDSIAQSDGISFSLTGKWNELMPSLKAMASVVSAMSNFWRNIC